MRALAAIVALALCCPTLAHSAHDLAPKLLSALGINKHSPVSNLISCSRQLGPTKCISALSAWRAEKALLHLEQEEEPQTNMTADVKQFPWKRYSNASDEEIYTKLCDGAEKLLRYRSMTFSMIPGYSFELESRNGKLNVDVLKNDETSTGRGMMKKLQKQFYDLVPIMIIPGLIMSAILPFVLPALKLMTVAVGMLNNMALSGAVFTLLRNNAFNDYYEKKVIYVNEGYKNEKLPPLYYKELDLPVEHIDFHHFSPSNIRETVVKPDGSPGNINAGPSAHFGPNTQFVGNAQFADVSGLHGMANMAQFDDVDISNAQWIDEYYGNEAAINNAASSQRVETFVAPNAPNSSPAKVRRSSQRKTYVRNKN